jgi:hypothetical protein
MRETAANTLIAGEIAMIEALASKDIQNFLNRLSVAIKLDQILVDALPRERFSPEYSDSMWRVWRHDHQVFIDELLSTADAIPPAMLSELTEIAITHKPGYVGSVALELFALIVSGSYSREDFGTAELFFGEIILLLKLPPEINRPHESARASILQWLPVADPLRIAQDPECGYGEPCVLLEKR